MDVSGEHAAPSSGLNCVGSEIISVNREVKRKVIMTQEEKEKIVEPGPTQWEEMDKKGPKRGPYKGHIGLSSK
jgi:hypothetical protein